MKKQYRNLFDCNIAEPKKVIEPLTPTSNAAISHILNPYVYSNFNYKNIIENFNKATNNRKCGLNWTQKYDLYSKSFPYFMRSCDSVRSNILQIYLIQRL